MNRLGISTTVPGSERIIVRRCHIGFAVICCMMLAGVMVISRTDLLLSSDAGPDMLSYIGGMNFVRITDS